MSENTTAAKTGSEVNVAKTSTKGITMKTAPKKTTGKGIVKKSTNNKTKKTQVITPDVLRVKHPVEEKLSITPFNLKKMLPDTVKITDRVKTSRSYEYKVQVMILDGATKEEVQAIFFQKFAGQDKTDKWILGRGAKYFTQERNHILAGCIIKDRHPKVTVKKVVKPVAKKKVSKKSSK